MSADGHGLKLRLPDFLMNQRRSASLHLPGYESHMPSGHEPLGAGTARPREEFKGFKA
jgi:hypothetical protein